MGLLIGDLSSSSRGETTTAMRLAAIEWELNEAGYTVVLSSHRNGAREKEALHHLEDFRCDGIVYMPGVKPASQSLHALAKRRFPLVTMGYDVGLPCPLAAVDFESGGRLVVEHLWRQGARRMAYVYVDCGELPAHEPLNGRLRGWRMAHERLIGPWEQARRFPMAPAPSLTEHGYAAGRQLAPDIDRIDAIVCANDLMAISLVAGLRDAGVNPAHMPARVAGYDNIPALRYLEPAMVTVAQPSVEVGRMASRLIVQAIEQPEQTDPGHRALLMPTLIDHRHPDTTKEPLP